ncbi:twin-arginine translocation signal domain-containing protein [Vibrio toranzoniae]|uniref:twin-arginine translocation signal domain-containing protein n=1 Tax=Vibrio toranzoniae TaxID=1194427 RepID=UPI0013765B69|nr:twin-arginine translocation signal domain-containing protein [Vibrio toranzoniae]
MKDNKEIDTSRRDLLKGLTTAAVAGAVVAGTTKVAAASETVEMPEKDVKKTGYRETQHIRDYYDTL